MSAGAEKLVRMVNQIARFFDSQRGDAARETVQHLKSYWAPSMRADLVQVLRAGGGGLGVTAHKAAEILAADQAGSPRQAADGPNA